MSTALEVQRTPVLIAAEINSIKSQTRTMILCNSIEIGRRLVEAKSMIDHGEWGKWLTESVDYSQRTASNLMRIFEEYGSSQLSIFGENAKSQALANLGYTQAVALLGLPEEEREQFIEENDIDSMTTRELQQAIKERDEALKKLEIAQKVAKEKGEEALKLSDDKHQLEANARVTDKAYRDAQADVKMLQDTIQKEKDQAKADIKKLEKALAEAKASGNNEEVKRLEESLTQTDEQLEAANNKIKELEQQLKEKPIDVPATIEKIPEEIEKELEELRKKQHSAAAVKFRLSFDNLVNDFKVLLGALEEITDEEERGQYRKATTGLIEKMSERL